jgi:hypothetical protein
MAKSMLGFDWDVEGQTAFHGNDGLSLLLFVRQDKVLAAVEHPRAMGRFHQAFRASASRGVARASTRCNVPRPAAGAVPQGAAVELAAGQLRQRIDRLAVAADLEVQHVARRAGVAHARDHLPGGDARALAHQAAFVVRIGRQPFLGMLDDDQLAVTDQARAGIDHDAIGGRLHVLSGAAGDVDALPRLVAGDVAADQLALRGPAPRGPSASRRGGGGAAARRARRRRGTRRDRGAWRRRLAWSRAAGADDVRGGRGCRDRALARAAAAPAQALPDSIR